LGIRAVKAANCRTGILVGSSRYGAGVQDNDFGIGGIARSLQAALLELALDRGAVGLSRPATKILYVKAGHDTIVAAHPGSKATGSLAHPTWVRRCLLGRCCEELQGWNRYIEETWE
jgi:hypothetical protein